LVLYTSSATDASAVVVDRRDFDHPFVVDHKTYWCECVSEVEANYLAAYVNYNYANEKIKEFQSRGLFGPRDIHKLVVKLPFPRFQKNNPKHEALAVLGQQCARLAGNFVKKANVGEMQARQLGMVRTKLKEHLEDQLDQIDSLVAELSGGNSAFERKKAKRSRASRGMKSRFD
jgi:hypothetical protein